MPVTKVSFSRSAPLRRGQEQGMDVDGVSEPRQWKTNADMLSVMLVSIFRFRGNIVLCM